MRLLMRPRFAPPLLAPLVVLLAALAGGARADPPAAIPTTITELHARLAAEPGNAAAVRALGAALLRRGDADILLGLLPPGNRPAAAEGEARFWRGLALAVRGQREAAIGALDQAAGLLPDDPRPLLALAQQLAALQRLDQAEQAAQGAAGRVVMPDLRAEILALQGELRHLAGDAVAAERLFTEALLADPAAIPALVGHAAVLMSLGREDEAEAEARTALERVPDHPAARQVVATAQVARGQAEAALTTLRDVEKAPYAPSLLLRAMLRLNRGELDAARRDLDQYQAMVGADAPGQRLRGALLLRLHQPEAAVTALQDAAARAPDDVQTSALLAAAHLLTGNIAGAARSLDSPAGIEALRQMSAQMPNSPLPPTLSGIVHGQRGDTAAARAGFTRALAIDGNFVPALLGLGHLESDAGQHGAALAAFRRLVAQQPEMVKARMLLAQAQAATGAVAAAADGLAEWLGRHPGEVAGRAMLAGLYLRLRHYERARAELEAVVATGTNDAVALNNLAWLYERTDDPRALDLAERAYHLDPTSPQIADTLGAILVRRDQTERGLVLLRQAHANAPRAPEIRYHLAAALARSGHPDEARRLLDELVSEQVEFEEAAAARKLRASLERGG